MNELSILFRDIQNGACVRLEKHAVYHVRPEDSFALTGYYCTNTAAKDENPDGGRNVAVFLKDIRDVTI
ncbi:MAG: hypothetical protein K6G90_08565, partial [Clostridia bacterium]|nr:hypothetical protein [Clostridia bacterium]